MVSNHFLTDYEDYSAWKDLIGRGIEKVKDEVKDEAGLSLIFAILHEN